MTLNPQTQQDQKEPRQSFQRNAICSNSHYVLYISLQGLRRVELHSSYEMTKRQVAGGLNIDWLSMVRGLTFASTSVANSAS